MANKGKGALVILGVAVVGGIAVAIASSKPAQAAPPPAGKAHIVVNSTPTGAAVTLDGVATNKVTPVTLEVDPGTHTVTVQLSGYNDYSTAGTVAAGQTVTLNITLEPVGGGVWAPIHIIWQ